MMTVARQALRAVLLGLLLAACGASPPPPDPLMCRPAFYLDEDGALIDLCELDLAHAGKAVSS